MWLTYLPQWSVVSSCIVECFVSKPRTTEMHSRKVAHHGINRDIFAMTSLSCHAAVCTMPYIRHCNRARASARIIPTMGTETAVVKTNGRSLWWDQHIGILMTVSTSERLCQCMLLGLEASLSTRCWGRFFMNAKVLLISIRIVILDMSSDLSCKLGKP